MSSIFAKVFLDEDVDIIVADIIRSHGFEALTTQEAGRKGSSDADQLDFACEKSYVILTHNRVDFERLALNYFSSNSHHGYNYFCSTSTKRHCSSAARCS